MRFTPSVTTIRALFSMVAVIVLAAALARFVYLEADFPIQLTKSGAPMSDEGWSSNAAVRYWLFGYWYLPGDVNRVIMQPTFHLLQWVTLGILGVSLPAARLTAILLFLGLTILMARTIQIQSGLVGGLVAAALLTTDFHLFAYSRIALIDLPMLFFVIASLWLMVTLGSKRAFLGGVLAGLACSLALLTKSTALFAMPALLLIAATGIETSRLRLRRSLAFLAATVLSTGTHFSLVMRFFPEDLPVWWFLIASKIRGGGPGRWERAWSAIRIMGGRDPLLCVALLISAIVILLHWRKTSLASQRISLFYLLGAASLFAVIASTHYQPVRYFVPFIALAIGIVSLATALAISDENRSVAIALVLLVALHIGLGTHRIVDYLAHPKWSYSIFCEQLKSDLEGADRPALLMGDLAPQVSLATGIEAISGLVGTEPAAWRFRKYEPTHLITRGEFSERLDADLAGMGELELVKTYDVLENHYGGPVHLHRVVQPSNQVGTRNYLGLSSRRFSQLDGLEEGEDHSTTKVHEEVSPGSKPSANTGLEP